MSRPFLDLSDIRTIQIDPTSKCNLRCPQCARIHKGKVLANLELTDLKMSDYDRIYCKEIAPNIKDTLFNGNFGDPAAASHLKSAVELILKRTNGTVHIVTNGSLQSKDWWRDLAKMLKGCGKVTFSIDGLKDTNHLYRVGSNFDRILDNARMFIASGGKAKWDFLVFSHNQHQIEEARSLAIRLGFAEFNLKYSKRYISENSLKENVIDQERVDGMSSDLKESLHVQKSQEILNKFKTWENYFQTAKISCKFQKNRMIFVDFKARVWPCTWVAAPPYFIDNASPQKISIERAIRGYKKDFNSLRHYSFKEILSHPWLHKRLTESWESERIITCARTCGDQIEYTNGFHQNSKLEILKNADKDILPTSLDSRIDSQ